MLRYRVSIIVDLLNGQNNGTILEVGCGTGTHLFELSEKFCKLIGTDLSPAMIKKAEQTRQAHFANECFSFSVDAAEKLENIDDAGIDVVLCVGAFEHMMDQKAVLNQVKRVLIPGGAFLCLTPNADYIWYSLLAPGFGYDYKHLSSDHFNTQKELFSLIHQSGLRICRIGFWRFIPKGDLPLWASRLLTALDPIGRVFGISGFRGGILLKAKKPLD